VAGDGDTHAADVCAGVRSRVRPGQINWATSREVAGVFIGKARASPSVDDSDRDARGQTSRQARATGLTYSIGGNRAQLPPTTSRIQVPIRMPVDQPCSLSHALAFTY
jgi:hypothetical protein